MYGNNEGYVTVRRNYLVALQIQIVATYLHGLYIYLIECQMFQGKKYSGSTNTGGYFDTNSYFWYMWYVLFPDFYNLELTLYS